MTLHSSVIWLAPILILGLAACGEKTTTGDTGIDTGSDTHEVTDGTDDPDDDGDALDEPEAVTDVVEEEVYDPGPLSDIALPQAVADTMWANPDTYAEIPLHVAVTGLAEAVTVTVDGGDPITASDLEPDGDWIAMIPIGALTEDFHTIEATAIATDVEPLVESAQLGIGRAGVQLTDFDDVGMAGVPHIHRVGDEVWLTWTDRSDTDAEAWLREIDGAARWTTDPLRLVDATEETLYSRTAIGDTGIAVIYQSPGGGPYYNHIKVVDFDGTELMPPLSLDPGGWYGSFGGEVVYDGSGFVAVWRINDGGSGGGEVRWLRIEETTWNVTGPVVVAEAGEGTASDPVGGFDIFSFVDVRALGDVSIVSFVRHRYDTMLTMTVPKAQLALLDSDGTIEWSAFAGQESAWTYGRECRLFDIDDTVVSIWSEVDLTDPALNPPNLFYATQTDAAGELDPMRASGVVMFDQVDDRDEPFLVSHPDHLGVMAWWDHRAYTLGAGGIRLYAVPVASDLTTLTDQEVVFGHARCTAGVTHTHATNAGTNVLVVWIDERNRIGLEPRPELWFETIWL